MESTGERIKRRRKELYLTQNQIKQLTGISSGNMSDFEHDKILPSATALISLSSVLGCSIDWLLTGNSPIPEPSVLSSEEEIFIEYFRLLNADDHKEILLLMQLKCERLKRDKSSNSIEYNENLA